MIAEGEDFFGYDSGGEEDNPEADAQAALAATNSLRRALLQHRTAAAEMLYQAAHTADANVPVNRGGHPTAWAAGSTAPSAKGDSAREIGSRPVANASYSSDAVAGDGADGLKECPHLTVTSLGDVAEEPDENLRGWQAFSVHSFEALDQASMRMKRPVPPRGVSLGRSQRLAAALAACHSSRPWHEGASAHAPARVRPMSAPVGGRTRAVAPFPKPAASVDSVASVAPVNAQVSATHQQGPPIIGVAVGRGTVGSSRGTGTGAAAKSANPAVTAPAVRVPVQSQNKAAPAVAVARPASTTQLSRRPSRQLVPASARTVARPPARPRIAPPRFGARGQGRHRRQRSPSVAAEPSGQSAQPSSAAPAAPLGSPPAAAPVPPPTASPRNDTIDCGLCVASASEPPAASSEVDVSSLQPVDAPAPVGDAELEGAAQQQVEEGTIGQERKHSLQGLPPASPMVTPPCAICFEAVNAGVAAGFGKDGAAGVHTLECGHAFHAGCINQWLSESPTCPLCKCRCTGDGGPEAGA